MKRLVPKLTLLLFCVLFSCGKDGDLETYVVKTEEEPVVPEDPNGSADDQPGTPDTPGTPDGKPDIPANGVKASTFGYDPNNATEALKEAILSDNEIIIIDKQASDWIVEPIVFFDLKDKQIYFEEGVVVRDKNGAFLSQNDQLFEFFNAENVRVEGYGATLSMDRDRYPDGEARHLFSLRSCKDFIVRGLTFTGSGGDGIYISGSRLENSYSENIIVEDVKLIRNKRQGMSITNAKNVWVRNSLFTETHGALPEAGVDLEPNKSTDRLVNINFENCQFTKNGHAGIVLALPNLDNTSEDISVKFIDCFLSRNATLENQFVDSEIVLGSNRNSPIGGNVLFERLTIEDSQWGMFYSRKGSESYHVTFKDVVARNICKAGTFSPIVLEPASYDQDTPSLGGFTFENVYVEYDTDVPVAIIRGAQTLGVVKDINGDFKVKSSKNDRTVVYRNYDENKNVNVSIVVDLLE